MIPRWLITLTVMLPTLIEIVDISIVNVSLDHIRGSLSAGIDESTWAITSYLVSNAIVIPLSGWMARLVGRKRYLIGSITLFTVSSLLCGMAWSLQSLIFFRVLQGIGGGGLQPLSQSILLETYPPKQHGMAMGIFGIGAMFGPILGPILGGTISDNLSWRWIFYINVPIGIIAVLLTAYAIVDPPYMKRKAGMTIDYIGILLLAVGIGALQILLDKGERADWFAADYITVLALVSAACLSVFVVYELYYTDHPVLDLRVMKNVSFTTGNLVMFFAFMCFFSSIVLLPIYLQTLMGYTSTLAGYVLGPGGIATLFTMPIVGKMVSKGHQKKLITIGICLNAYALFMLSGIDLYTDFHTVSFYRIVLGVGIGMIFVPLTTLTLSTVPKEGMGNASAIYNFLRNLGGGFGVALVTTIVSQRAQFHQARLVEHLTVFDKPYRFALDRANGRMIGAGAGFSGDSAIFRELQRQASMLSFNDAFYVSAVMMVLVLPMMLLIKKGKAPSGPAAVH